MCRNPNSLIYLVLVSVVYLAFGTVVQAQLPEPVSFCTVHPYPYQQDPGQDAIVSMEAENFDENIPNPPHAWIFVREPEGFSGTGAMRAMPDSDMSYLTHEYTANSPHLDFEVNFSKTGTHYVWIRGYGVDKGADSVHVTIDAPNTGRSNADTIQTGSAYTWEWSIQRMQNLGPAQIEVASAGVHTVNMWMREDGMIVDKIVLTTNPDYTPTGAGPEESSRTEPNPADGTTDVPREVVLSWAPGELANTHDVYLGTVFDDVNDADRSDPRDVLFGQDHNHTTYEPDYLLDFGQIYYWRIDEVNAPPEPTVFKGDVWSFTTELFAYPIENITATASSSASDQGPEKTIDSSGVDVNDLHSTDPQAMWLSEAGDPGSASIQYEFDKLYKLYEILVWNYNGNSFLSLYGLKEVTIEYSTDGTNFSQLENVPEFVQAIGEEGYAANTTVAFNGAAAKYVKITANSNWGGGGGFFNQYGLSEVRFTAIPVSARKPSPDSGATGVDVDVILGWKAGREAASHDVYVSADPNALILAGPVTEPAFDTASLDLALGQTYHWRVDEVNAAETTTMWQGDIWKFTTSDFLVVDDFEEYNDYEPDLIWIWRTWVDGYVEPPAVRTNGSTMGHTVQYEPSMELVTVYDCSQSAPLYYDNTTVGFSEVTANLTDLGVSGDWTKHAIGTLTVWFYGDLNNDAQQLYVKINDTKILHDDPESLKQALWQMWPIDLSTYDVSDVSTLSIGLDRLNGVDGDGMVLLDAIRLY